MGGEREDGEVGGVEGSLACGDTSDESFATYQAHVADLEACRL